MSFIFLRHSQRSKKDLSMEKSLNRTGKYHSNACLIDKLKDLNITEIYCSPFMRCLQTVEQFSNENSTPIKVESSLAEKYSQTDLEKITCETPDQENYYEIIKNFNVDKEYIPLYSVNNLLEKEYNIFNETFEERIELFVDFLNNCKENLQRDRNILIVSHSSVLQKLIFDMYNEDVSLKMGDFLIKKLSVMKQRRKMSLRKSFLM
jgi:broad specificity phosphatase PhoE